MVGRSHEDDFPKSIQHLPVLTASKTVFTSSKDIDTQVRSMLQDNKSLYSLDAELLKSLRPDVIVTQDLCDVCSIDLVTVERLVSTFPDPKPRVITLNPQNLDDVLDSIRHLGSELNMPESVKVYNSLQSRIAAVSKRAAKYKALRGHLVNIFYVEWLDPIFCGGHWTPQMLEIAGGKQVLNNAMDVNTGAGKSYVVEFEDIQKAVSQTPSKKLDVTIVSPCGLDIPTTLKEIANLKDEGLERWNNLQGLSSKVIVIDGNQYMNRSGPRLVDALEFLVAYINGETTLPEGFPYHVLKDLQ